MKVQVLITVITLHVHTFAYFSTKYENTYVRGYLSVSQSIIFSEQKIRLFVDIKWNIICRKSNTLEYKGVTIIHKLPSYVRTYHKILDR